MLKKIAILFVAVSAVFAASAQKTARVYGVRVYSDPSEPWRSCHSWSMTPQD